MCRQEGMGQNLRTLTLFASLSSVVNSPFGATVLYYGSFHRDTASDSSLVFLVTQIRKMRVYRTLRRTSVKMLVLRTLLRNCLDTQGIRTIRRKGRTIRGTRILPRKCRTSRGFATSDATCGIWLVLASLRLLQRREWQGLLESEFCVYSPQRAVWTGTILCRMSYCACCIFKPSQTVATQIQGDCVGFGTTIVFRQFLSFFHVASSRSMQRFLSGPQCRPALHKVLWYALELSRLPSAHG